MATIVSREQNIQHIFRIRTDDGSIFQDAIFYTRAEFDAKTQAELDADALARYEKNAAVSAAPVELVSKSLSAEEQQAESVASLKETVAELSAQFANVVSKVEAL